MKDIVCNLKALTFIAIAIISVEFVYPDDAPITQVELFSGGISLINSDNTDIQMKAEKVEINLYKDYYTVDAEFGFYNYGESSTIKIGFPYYSVTLYAKDYSEKYINNLYIEDFKTWVNGEECDFEDTPGELIVNKKNPGEKYVDEVSITDVNEINRIKRKLRENDLAAVNVDDTCIAEIQFVQ